MVFPDKTRSPKPKHRVFDVCGRVGTSQLVHGIASRMLHRYERTHVLILGADRSGLDTPRKDPESGKLRVMEDAPAVAFPSAIRRLLVDAHGKSEDEAKALVGRYLHFEQLVPEDISASFASRECARLSSDLVNHGRLCGEGPRLIYRTVVVFDDEDEYLRLFLDRLTEPVRVFFVDDFRVGEGIFPREGFEEECDLGKVFDSREDFEASGEMEWLVKGLMHKGEITGWIGLAKHGKSWLLLALIKALLSGEPFLGKWPVVLAEKVVYFVPEVGRASVYARLKKMRLDKYLDEKLFVRTSALGVPDLADPRVLAECEGADVFLDTLIRFIEGSENSAEDVAALAAKCFNVLAVARSVNFAAHTQKAFESLSAMSQGMIRGSGDIAAFATNAYGVAQTDAKTNTVYVGHLFNRDLPEDPMPFVVVGRPWIDETGDFKLVDAAAGPLSEHKKGGGKTGAPADPEKEKKLEFLRLNFPENATGKEMAEALNKQFNSNHASRTAKDWRREAETKNAF